MNFCDRRILLYLFTDHAKPTMMSCPGQQGARDLLGSQFHNLVPGTFLMKSIIACQRKPTRKTHKGTELQYNNILNDYRGYLGSCVIALFCPTYEADSAVEPTQINLTV